MTLTASCTFEAVKIAWIQDKNGYILKLSIHPSDVPDGVAMDPLGTRYTVGIVRADEQASTTEHRGVQAAGLLCRNNVFQKFLRLQYGARDVVDEATAAAALRSILGVRTRSEISGASAQKMMEISNEFRKWYASASAPGRDKGVEEDFGL